jgi:hypothetical protein
MGMTEMQERNERKGIGKKIKKGRMRKKKEENL